MVRNFGVRSTADQVLAGIDLSGKQAITTGEQTSQTCGAPEVLRAKTPTNARVFCPRFCSSLHAQEILAGHLKALPKHKDTSHEQREQEASLLCSWIGQCGDAEAIQLTLIRWHSAGGNSGIGAETVRALAAAGANVVLTARSPKAGEKVAADIKASGVKVTRNAFKSACLYLVQKYEALRGFGLIARG